MASLLNRFKPKKMNEAEDDLLRGRLEQLRQEQLNILAPPDAAKPSSTLFHLFAKPDDTPELGGERRRSTSVTAPGFLKNPFKSSSSTVGNQDDVSVDHVVDMDEAAVEMLHMERRRSSSLTSSFLKNPFARSASLSSSFLSTAPADEDDDRDCSPITTLPDGAVSHMRFVSPSEADQSQTSHPYLSSPQEDPMTTAVLRRNNSLASSFMLKNPFRASNPLSDDGDDSSSTSSNQAPPSSIAASFAKVTQRFSRAVSRTSDASSTTILGRYVGEPVHTAAGAGTVTEVKADGSAIVRLCNTAIVNCSSVIIEHDGEIEPLPALPGDFVFTQVGPGTVTGYDPKTRTFTIEIADEMHTMAPSDIISSSEKSAETTDEEDDFNDAPAPPKSATSSSGKKNNVAMDFALRATKFLIPSASPAKPKYLVGQTVFSTFGDGTIVEFRPDQTYVIEFSSGGVGFMSEDAIKCVLKAKVSDAVSTRFGTGVVVNVVEENVYLVRVKGEDVHVHSTDLQLSRTKSWRIMRKNT